MNKIKNIISIAIIFATFSCGESFLDSEELYKELDVDFYSNAEEIEQALAAVYSVLSNDQCKNHPLFIAELLSDDRLGGGGADNIANFQACDAFIPGEEDQYIYLWTNSYQGIFRANMIIKSFDQAVYDNESDRNQALGEAHFLRAYYYLNLAQFFGQVPLITDPEPANLPKAEPEEIFAQIASDLKTAIEIMPATRYTSLPDERIGHATKWAAEALMARAFLFYTGYYEQDAMPLAGGTSVTQTEVLNWLEDCITNSGHGLISDFRNLWPYSFANEGYPYAAYNSLEWTGQDGDNIETIWAIKYSTYGGWNSPDQVRYSNQLQLYFGLREQDYLPFGFGWGGGPVNPQIWGSFEEGDLRREGSILNMVDPDTLEGEIVDNYVWGSNQQYQETGYWQKKYIPIEVLDADSNLVSMFYLLYGGDSNSQLWNMQDDVLIRFADVLLMAAELGSANAQSYMDQIRSRAGLGSVSPTLENIKRERRHELAFEGLRYFDLLRWHDAEEAFAQVKDIPIQNVGVESTYSVTFRPETGGFLPIPESEIRLSDGVLEQNEGW